MARAYKMLYDSLRARLADCDLEARALQAGLPPPVNGVIRCPFLGRTYLISRNGVDKADDRPDNINSRSLLIHYLWSEGEGEPSGEFVPMSQLTGLVPGQKSHDDFFAQPLLAAWGRDRRGPIPEAARLGGVPEAAAGAGEHRWRFQALPKIALKLVHYEPDDEFPLEFRYLFDRRAIKVLEYECLAFLIGCFNYELLAAVKSAEVTSPPA